MITTATPQLSHRQNLLLIALVSASVAAGQISLFYAPNAGAYINTLSLALLLILAANSGLRARNVMIAAALIPLLSLVNLAIVQQSAFNQTAILYGSMLILALVYIVMFRQRSDLIRRHRVRFYIFGVIAAAATGSLLALLDYLLLKHAYIFGGTGLGWVMAVAVLGALAEEFLFHGLILRQAMNVIRQPYAVLLTVLLFGTLSFSHFSGWALPLGLLSATVLSIVYARTRSLVLTITLNLASKLVYVALIAKYLLR